ncbi:ATP-binding protein [Sulfobacillus thermosulfidooxidans]|uniref:ATP-binding protein n=1 Tax=Sulfobacillus thermosulfidooxidans TaxID=28034 RepID=UPI000411F87B|nr:DUF499 domain-containing protein [Sulfobacillus thermosulfidooxidans]
MGVRDGAFPHEYILNNQLTDADFAADLMRLYRQQAAPVYQDPEAFLRQTYPTNGLEDTLRQVFGRLQHVVGSAAVIRLETAFGGGKTHVMSTVYHLARDGYRFPELAKNFLPDALVPSTPIKTVVLVGDKYSGNHCVSYDDGVETRTLWGEMAYQIGGKRLWDQWKSFEDDRQPPSDDALYRLFGTNPVIILMDELPAYIRTAKSVAVGHTTLAGVTIPFMQRLLTLAASLPNVVVLYSLAREAYAEEAEELLRELEAVSARVETVIRPTGDADIAAIVTRRLFESIDPHTAEIVAQQFQHYYHEALKRDWPVPSDVVSAEYRNALRVAYPFHPALLEILDRKVATIPDFNKTRGALRVLAQTVQNLWASDEDPDIILPGFVDVTEARLQPQLTSRIKREAFTHALRADLGNDYGDAHAQQLDRQWEARAGTPVVSEIGRVIYLHSLVQGKASGASVGDVLLGVARPGLDLDLVQTALDDLINRAWYIIPDGRLFRFQTEPSLNKVVADEMAMIQNADVRDNVVAKIQQVFQQGVFQCVYHPIQSQELDDKPVLRLVLTSPDGPLLDLRTTQVIAPNIPPYIADLFANHGTELRRFRNSLVFLVADEGGREDLYRQARRQQALNRIVQDPMRQAALANQWDRLVQDHRSSSQEVSRAIFRTYRHLFYPDGSEAGLAYRVVEPQQDDFPKGQGQHMVERALRERPEGPKLLKADDPPKAAEWLQERAWDFGHDEITTEALYHTFFRRGALPFLAAADPLKESIRQAVKNREWVYQAGTTIYFGETCTPVIAPDVIVMTSERAKNLGLGPWADHLEPTQTADPKPMREVNPEPPLAPGWVPPEPTPLPQEGKILKGTADEVIQQLRDFVDKSPIAKFHLAAEQLVVVNQLVELSSHPQWIPNQMKASFYIEANQPEVVRLDYTGSPKRFQRFKGTIVPFLVEALRERWNARVMVMLTYVAEDGGYPVSALIAWLQQVLGSKPGQIVLTVLRNED